MGGNSAGQLVVALTAFGANWRVVENCGSHTTSGKFDPLIVLL